MNGDGVADWCIRDIKRLVDSENDAQNPIPVELEEELSFALEQMRAKFKEIARLSERAQQAWERMVDEHL